MLPEQITAFRVYKGNGAILGVATAESPQVSFITETVSGSGIAGEYESSATGMPSSMTLKLTFNSQTKDFYQLMEIDEDNQIELRASQQVADQTTGLKKHLPLRVSALYDLKSASLGSFETGKKMGNEQELELMRLLVELDGKEVLLIDKLNMMYRVNGRDKLAQIRSNIGLDY